MDSKKIRRIQVPNSLIVDRDFSHYAFALYIELKIKSYNDKVNIYPMSLKEGLGWTDNRTLKKHFKELYDNNLVDIEIQRIVNTKPIECNITPIGDDKFTQVDVHTIQKIKDCTNSIIMKGKKKPQNLTEMGLRLFYYYEKNYNEAYGKAFPTYENINEDTKIHPSYIKALNTVFHENGIVSVELGQYYSQELDDTIVTRRAGNTYIPICIRY